MGTKYPARSLLCARVRTYTRCEPQEKHPHACHQKNGLHVNRCRTNDRQIIIFARSPVRPDLKAQEDGQNGPLKMASDLWMKGWTMEGTPFFFCSDPEPPEFRFRICSIFRSIFRVSFVWANPFLDVSMNFWVWY